MYRTQHRYLFSLTDKQRGKCSMIVILTTYTCIVKSWSLFELIVFCKMLMYWYTGTTAQTETLWWYILYINCFSISINVALFTELQLHAVHARVQSRIYYIIIYTHKRNYRGDFERRKYVYVCIPQAQLNMLQIYHTKFDLFDFSLLATKLYRKY